MSKKESQSVTIRLQQPVLDGIDKAITESPIEFKDRTEFIKRAIEAELRRRKVIKTYKD